jgi:hypothetical protein
VLSGVERQSDSPQLPAYVSLAQDDDVEFQVAHLDPLALTRVMR